jgi:NADH-quinone oxidoreductase subunit J
MQTILFYILGVAALTATLLCVTRRNVVHAILYLVNALFSLALMFYQLGAPLVAAWEVIIYAGAIMVLFLFIIMMFEPTPIAGVKGNVWLRWGPLMLLSAVLLTVTVLLMAVDPARNSGVPSYYASPQVFGFTLFHEYALAVEVISFQLLFAAVGAYYVGRSDPEAHGKKGVRL